MSKIWVTNWHNEKVNSGYRWESLLNFQLMTRTAGMRATVGVWGWDIEEGPFAAPTDEVLARQQAVLDAFPQGGLVDVDNEINALPIRTHRERAESLGT